MMDEIDEIDEIYEPPFSPPYSPPFSPAGYSVTSLPSGFAASTASFPDLHDIHVSKVQLHLPHNFVVPDRDMRDVPAGKYGFEAGNAYGSADRDPRDAAVDLESPSGADEVFRDLRALSDLHHRTVPDPDALDEGLHVVPDTVLPASTVAPDGSDPNALHCWGRLPRTYRTAIIMFSVFSILLLLIVGILFPIGGTVEATTRVLYIAAIQEPWDYLPSGADLVFGQDGPLPDQGKFYLGLSPPNRIGSMYMKARYQRYTDSNFSTPYEDPQQELRGILGPTIYCQIGDEIVIHFRNKLPFPTSIHAQGVAYEKDSEAWVYGDEIGQEASPLVQPDQTREYRWTIPEMSGPETADGLSVAYLYYPGQGAVADWNSGLIGMIVVTRMDGTKSDGTPAQAAGNFPLLFATFDENKSPFLDESGAAALGAQWSPSLKSDPGFAESNRIASVNGRAFANLPPLTIEKGTYVQWYLAAMANELPDTYVPQWHGNTLVVDSHRLDAIELVPGGVFVAEMRPPNTGCWLIRSSTSSLYDRGVSLLYNVTNPAR